jgi:DNA-binding transcriptional LysR family regulator
MFSRQINQFIATVQTGSLMKASDRISVTPSAMSRGISELENKIGEKLVKKTRSGMVPTEKGLWLYNKIIPHYNEISRLDKYIKENKENRKNIIKICVDGVFYPKLKRNIISIMKENPHKKIIISQVHSESYYESLFHEGFDIYISTKNMTNIEHGDDICTISTPPEQIGLVVHNSIVLKKYSLKTILHKMDLVQRQTTINHSCFKLFIEELEKQDFKFNVLAVPDLTDVFYLVNNGCGVSMMSKSMMENELFDKQNMTFIDKPFPFQTLLNRHICFKKDRFDDFIDICTKLAD